MATCSAAAPWLVACITNTGWKRWLRDRDAIIADDRGGKSIVLFLTQDDLDPSPDPLFSGRVPTLTLALTSIRRLRLRRPKRASAT
jgi:hypothetical protein